MVKLRKVTGRAMQAKAELLTSENLTQDQADELAMDRRRSRRLSITTE